jgi:hypothetical protein
MKVHVNSPAAPAIFGSPAAAPESTAPIGEGPEDERACAESLAS